MNAAILAACFALTLFAMLADSKRIEPSYLYQQFEVVADGSWTWASERWRDGGMVQHFTREQLIGLYSTGRRT